MTRAVKKKSKAEAIEILEALVAQGRALAMQPVAEPMSLAEAAVSRMEWMFAVTQALPQMTRGIQVVADFNRVSTQGRGVALVDLPREVEMFRENTLAQVKCLAEAVDKWKRSNTRPLT